MRPSELEARVGEKNTYGRLTWKPEGKRPLGKSRHGCEAVLKLFKPVRDIITTVCVIERVLFATFKLALRKSDEGTMTGLMWLRVGTDGGLL
jgi:hypothetical protein